MSQIQHGSSASAQADNNTGSTTNPIEQLPPDIAADLRDRERLLMEAGRKFGLTPEEAALTARTFVNASARLELGKLDDNP